VVQDGTKCMSLGAEDYLQGVIGMVNDLVSCVSASPVGDQADEVYSLDYRSTQ
jgi:hypothetical protein